MLSDSDSPRLTEGAAARALNTHDILCQVFQVDKRLNKSRKLSRKDLLRLWRDMSPPDPLWRLLAPAGLSPKDPTSTSSFLDVILSEKAYADPARWSRFMWYARFVKKLHTTTGVWADTLKHQQLVRALVEHNGGESIFPSLQTLWWSPASYTDSSYFPPFTLQVRFAHFRFPFCKPAAMRPDEDAEGCAFLARLQASSPRLSHLALDMWREHMGSSYVRVISSFEHLTRLNLTASISLASFREIASMPRMESLKISCITSDDLEPSPHPLSQIDAPCLELISVSGDCLSLRKLFTALQAPVLRSASLEADFEGNNYVACLEAIATAGASSTLEDLHVTLDEDFRDVGEPYPPPSHLKDLLSPFFVFRNMEDLSLACPEIALVAADSDFDAVARAWPHLRAFELRQAYWAAARAGTTQNDDDDDGTSIPTPRLLESFRDHCPHLRDLTLPYLDLGAEVPVVRPYAWLLKLTLKPGGWAMGRGHRLRRLAFGRKDAERLRDLDWDDSDDSDEDVDVGGDREPGAAASADTLDGDSERAVGWAWYFLTLFPKLDAGYGRRECGRASARGWKEVFGRVREICRAWKRADSCDGASEAEGRRRSSSVPVTYRDRE